MTGDQCRRDGRNEQFARSQVHNQNMTTIVEPASMLVSVQSNLRQSTRASPIAQSGRASTYGDSAYDNATHKPRKRIQVACARCRKRKIKCSGDRGNGKGCHNCQLAGVDVQSCQFNRMHAVVLQYPMLASAAEGSSRTSPELSLDVPLSKAAVDPSWYSSTSEQRISDTAEVSSNNILRRHHPVNAAYSCSDHPRSWHADSRRELVMPSQYTLNNVSNAQLSTQGHQSVYSPQQMNRAFTATLDPYSTFTMTGLHSSLPSNLLDRQLPIPHTGRSHAIPSTADMGMSLPNPLTVDYDSQGPNRGGAAYTKPAHWNPEFSFTGDRLGCTRGVYSPASSLMNMQKGPMPSSDDAIVSIDYAAIENIPETSVPGSTSIAYDTTSGHVPHTKQVMNYPRTFTGRLSSSSSNENMRLRHELVANLYSFSSDNAIGGGSFGDDPTEARLVSGQKYAPLQEPQPHNVSDVDCLQQTTLDRVLSARRSSVPELRD